ncbi:MAG: cytochrome b/b6 domain-containing protein [Sphingomonadaceae bacterium]|nr:cytochrome b/b6 domain-containing protein [Sphingomonadaceae bacterium]
MSRETVVVWDLPTRLFHWAIVLLVPALWWTHQIDRLDLHILLGEIMLGLVLFRLIWGVIGGSTARFTSFLRGPGTVLRYLRGRGTAIFGHNPAGGWSVIVMLLLLAVQVGLGLFVSDEDGLNTGPLSHLVSYESARTLADRHETVFYILLGFIAFHVGAILYYQLVRRDRLVGPMLSGRRAAPESGEAMIAAPLWRFVLAAALAAILTWIVSNYL